MKIKLTKKLISITFLLGIILTGAYFVLGNIGQSGPESAPNLDNLGLVGHWNFEEGSGQIIYDRSGNGNDGTLGANSSIGKDDPVFAAGHDSNGPGGTGMEFDGVDDYVDLGDVYDGVKTVSFWAKADDLSKKMIDLNSWYSADWDYRKPITIQSDEVETTETSFPVLVSVTDTDLIYGGAGHVLQADGYDIIFTDGDGTTLLDFEVESWDDSTGEIQAWVETDISATVDKTIYIYYGYASATDLSNAEGVWDNGFVMVQHLDETGSNPQVVDSTSNNNDSSSNSADPNASGKIDGAMEFNGSDDNINGSMSGLTNFIGTVGCWIYPHSEGEEFRGSWIRLSPAFGWNVAFFVSPGINRPKAGLADGSNHIARAGSDNDITLNAWNYVVYTYDGSAGGTGMKIYVNGEEVTYSSTIGTEIISVAPVNFIIGADSAAGTYAFDGLVDEVHVSNTVRLADWIETEYNNQDSPETFLDFGDEQSEGIDYSIEVASGTITANNFTSPTIYVDGAVSSTIDTDWHHITITTDTGINANALKIGRIADGYFDGTIDEVRIYNRALSADEIRQLYNQKKPIFHLKMDEGSGTTVYDSSGNEYHGTLHE